MMKGPICLAVIALLVVTSFPSLLQDEAITLCGLNVYDIRVGDGFWYAAARQYIDYMMIRSEGEPQTDNIEGKADLLLQFLRKCDFSDQWQDKQMVADLSLSLYVFNSLRSEPHVWGEIYDTDFTPYITRYAWVRRIEMDKWSDEERGLLLAQKTGRFFVRCFFLCCLLYFVITTTFSLVHKIKGKTNTRFTNRR